MLKHSVRLLSVSAIGCALLASGALMTACEPVGNGVAPREPAPREPVRDPAAPPRDPAVPPRDPTWDEDPYDPGVEPTPGTQPGTQPGTPGT